MNSAMTDRCVWYQIQTVKSSAILGRSFSLTQSGLCVSVLLNTEATTVTIQRGKETWLRFASEHRLSECGELEEV